MKKVLFLSLALLLSIAYSQGSIKITLKFSDRGGPMNGAKVTLKETSNLGKIELVTNASGMVTTSIDYGKEWAIYVNGFQMRKMIEVPESGTAETSYSDTYDPVLMKRLAKQDYVRMGFTETPVDIEPTQNPPTGMAVAGVEVVSRDNKPIGGIEVGFVSVEDKVIYKAVTDNKGIAYFHGKVGKSYDIDVAGALNISYTDMPTDAAYQVTETVSYAAPKFTQTENKDTIIQDLNGITEPPSGFQYFKLTVLRGGKPIANEDVYLWDVKGKEVYTGVTNKEGIFECMLPIRRKFMIDFNYQKDVDIVDLSQSFGKSVRTMTLTYIPDPKLEHPEEYIPTPQTLVTRDFKEFVKKQFAKTKRVGIHAKFAGKINKDSKEAILEIGVNTNFAPASPKLNLSFVIDNSGSMAGYDRIERLKKSMAQMIPQLPGDAYLSLIVYNSTYTVILPPQKIGTSVAAIQNILMEIQPGGGTSMLDGMKKGYEFVKQNYDPKRVNKVILMTDGWDENEIAVLETAQKAWPEIECSTIGIGNGFNQPLLTILANNGKGKLFYVDSEGSYDSVFVKGMLANLSPVATNVTIEVEYNNKIVFKQLFGYTPVDDKSNPIQYKLPNLYSNSCEFALAKFDLNNPDSTIENNPVIIRVKYLAPETGLEIVEVEKVYLDWEPYTGEMEMIADRETKKLYLMAIINQSLKVMADQFSLGNAEAARLTIENCKAQVKAIYKEASDPDVNGLMRSLEEYLTAFKNLAKKKKK
jgi:uncharacterized protein YegL